MPGYNDDHNDDDHGYCDDDRHAEYNTPPVAHKDHPIHQSLDRLIEERNDARADYDRVVKGNAALVTNLSKIAEQLKCPASYDEVIAKLVDVRRVMSENEALRVTLAEVETSLEEKRAEDSLRDCIDEQQDTVRTLERKSQIENAEGWFGSEISTLGASLTNPLGAKNFVEVKMDWSDGVLPNMPFRKVALHFYREGGKSPGDVAKDAIDARKAVENELVVAHTMLGMIWELRGQRIEYTANPAHAVAQRASQDVGKRLVNDQIDRMTGNDQR